MPYKTIMVHLVDQRRAPRVLGAMLPLAVQMNAHLIGIAVLPPYVIVPGIDVAGAPVTVDQHRDAYREDMAKIKGMFLGATQGQTITSEWCETDAGFGTVAAAVIDHGRSADLIAVSQQDSDWAYSSMLEEPERLAIESGRPLLLIPNAGKATMPAKRITVAWNGRREAARAVFDSLPLLKGADEINVVWVNPDSDYAKAGDLPSADICATLARHDVKCQATQTSAIGGDVGVELLRQAAAFGSDLLVMGCYGHSRLREFVLGGASRDVLNQMRLPILMSH